MVYILCFRNKFIIDLKNQTLTLNNGVLWLDGDTYLIYISDMPTHWTRQFNATRLEAIECHTPRPRKRLVMKKHMPPGKQ